MKIILSLDGIHCAGKTTISRLLEEKIINEPEIKFLLFNRKEGGVFKFLYGLDGKYKIKSSELAKFSYRVSRLNFAINSILKQDSVIGVIERGILHFLVECERAKINPELRRLFFKDLIELGNNFKIVTVLLSPPINVAKDRIKKRNRPSKDDKNFPKLIESDRLIRKIYSNSKDLEYKIRIDTS